jgi:EmrB/QacA subfamily drug resistance transporter
MSADVRAAGGGRLVPLIIGAALLMQYFDATAIANALPAMAASLREDPLRLNLAITSYLLATAVFLPLSGWLADRCGARTVLLLAIALFSVSSLLCGLSRNFTELLTGRLLQGAAGAMTMPVGRLVLLKSVPKTELIRALSYLTMPALLGPMLGPPVGGLIVTRASWHWIFFVNVPLGVLGMALVALFVQNIREPVVSAFDWLGFSLVSAGVAGVVYGFENLGHGALPLAVVIALLLGGAAATALFVRHARRAAHPILDLSLLQIPTFFAATAGGIFIRLCNGASPFLLALLLQIGFGLSALSAGLLTFPNAVGALLMKVAAGPIVARLGLKRVLTGNAVLAALLFCGYGLFRASTPQALIFAALLLGGFFSSLQFVALNALAFSDVDPPRLSSGSTIAGISNQLSQSAGVGLAALLLGLFRGVQRSPALTAADISPAFWVIGTLSFLGLIFLARLRPDAGSELIGRKVDDGGRATTATLRRGRGESS